MRLKPLKLGCIADDFTGATDLANNLVRTGMRVLQTIGVPAQALEVEVDAVVVALKSRTCAADQAVQQSLQACGWLLAQGAPQIYFKYCSTFDSTPQGNIGPVIEALMAALDTDFTVATPAFPANQRTVFKGHLFVGDVLLSESGMQLHPLTPMTDSNLVRVLQAQCRKPVGLIDYATVAQGAQAIRQRMAQLRHQGLAVAVVDALCDTDLMQLGAALKDMPLITAASGVAIGVPQNFGLAPSDQASVLPPVQGYRAIVSGSCSRATLRQVQQFIASGGAGRALDPLQALGANPQDVVAEILAWAEPLLPQGAVLVYSSAPADAVSATQNALGASAAGVLIEHHLAAVARGLVALGVRQLVLAGGETAGACVQALGISQMQIGPQIDPGVPWCYAHSPQIGGAGLHLALKSGNFGSDEFFTRAFEFLQGARS